jgi:hypothetical protein
VSLAEDLEDDYFPNPELDDDNLTPRSPAPLGTRQAETGDGPDCKLVTCATICCRIFSVCGFKVVKLLLFFLFSLLTIDL